MSKFLGRFVVSDPAVCHGRPTFRGTRVFVSDVLDDVARDGLGGYHRALAWVDLEGSDRRGGSAGSRGDHQPRGRTGRWPCPLMIVLDENIPEARVACQ